MKFTNKKLVELFILVLIASIQLTLSARNENEKQINQVIDTRGFNTNLQTVVNRNPTVETLNRGSNFRLAPMMPVVDFSNSNTSNSPNVGNLGRTAEIVGKIFFIFQIKFRSSYCHSKNHSIFRC
jgi:hypothetical protein